MSAADFATFDADSRTWLLSTPASSYVVRLDPDDVPRHVYWGARIGLETAAVLEPPAAVAPSSFDGSADADVELAVEGGAAFGVAGLQIRYADGTRGFEWRYLDHTAETGELRLRFRDRHHPVELTLHYRVFADNDVIERWTTLRTGEPITVLRCDSAQFHLPRRTGYRVSHVVGGWSAEFQLCREELPHGETTFTSRRGNTSHHANPWVMLDAHSAGEEHGEVWSAALTWSGTWRITLHRTPDGRVGWTGGFGHEGVSWRLRADEVWITPMFAGLYTDGGFGSASRQWHSYTVGHVLPRTELRPILYNSWEATGFDVDVDSQQRLAAIAADLGVEVFVMDDGWFGRRHSDQAGLGDWHPNPERFPDDLTPLVDEVRRLGMRFGIWVEPEMVNPDSDLYREHPDWVLHMPTRRRTELRNQLVLNFARPDVASWAHKWLDRLVGDHRIDFLKWDMNRAFTEAGWPGHGDPDRLWIDHVRSVYAIMDRLRADHPGLRIESCSGGGGRVDLGVLSRTDQVWTSDNTDPVDRLAIQHGYSQVYPARTMAAWVTDSPSAFTGRRTPLRFRFHVAMAGVLGIGGDLSSWSTEELAEAGGLIAEYKAIRPTVQTGQLYRLTGDTDSAVSAVQYVAGPDAVVLAWRVSMRFGRPPERLRLTGLDGDAHYRDERTGSVVSGARLMTQGLDLDLPTGDCASTCVRLSVIN